MFCCAPAAPAGGIVCEGGAPDGAQREGRWRLRDRDALPGRLVASPAGCDEGAAGVGPGKASAARELSERL
jgi:hypothetical protein